MYESFDWVRLTQDRNH